MKINQPATINFKASIKKTHDFEQFHTYLCSKAALGYKLNKGNFEGLADSVNQILSKNVNSIFPNDTDEIIITNFEMKFADNYKTVLKGFVKSNGNVGRLYVEADENANKLLNYFIRSLESAKNLFDWRKDHPEFAEKIKKLDKNI